MPHKHGPALCCRPTFVKIVGDSLPSDCRQRQHVDAVGLASSNGQRARLPVNVVQVQHRYFARAKAEINQAANDRVVTLTLRLILLEADISLASSAGPRCSGKVASGQCAAVGIAAMSASIGSAY